MTSTVESLFPDVRDDAVACLRDGVSVSIAGLPGSGRSALLRDVRRALVERGWEVVEIPGVRGLRGRPLEAVAVAGLFDARGAAAGTALSSAVAAIRRAVEDRRPSGGRRFASSLRGGSDDASGGVQP